MSVLRKLAGQTAVYGLSSIIGRFLNYLLVPLYTRIFDTAEYGVVTQLYAYVAFLNIIFTYGMETAFFRFFQTEKGNKRVYSTALSSIALTSIIFSIAIILFSPGIASVISLNGSHGGKLETYLLCFAGILAFDALTAIPFARLRQQNKALKFASFKLFNIVLNIGLNLFFLVLCPHLHESGYQAAWLSSIYSPSVGVGYIFLSNLISSALTLILLLPGLKEIRFGIDIRLWKQMLLYSLPLMVGGMAGMVNETIDRILIPYLISDQSSAMSQLGIYGACYKLSILMTLFIQTFRYAAEPFFFSQSQEESSGKIYAMVMKWFVIVCSFIFLAVWMYIDLVKYFIGEEFRQGLHVVPVLLVANLFLGVYYNLSIWYKLSGKTSWGVWLALGGAGITLLFNFMLIPVLGYAGAAWTTLICYFLMMTGAYFSGQKFYPIPYQVKNISAYFILALSLFLASEFLRHSLSVSGFVLYAVNTVILLLYLFIVYHKEARKNG
ncbi:MAG: polysaccharide biosynthesis protein [Bacteroidetes bacterium]|nr:MAG: polysaccharide biosynthesis protein [Bacteroidota bacterium]REK04684.1 MAG: polysaccharide biosynthesis protein [Bacteroidota bacterium]REK36159.1 MAG: polysaccharide biosynthesis protein [Bacteroidota bacterium]REK51470.1 MAG: polysaccharide biosynthesis protein [Bacteroidota bacterium]